MVCLHTIAYLETYRRIYNLSGWISQLHIFGMSVNAESQKDSNELNSQAPQLANVEGTYFETPDGTGSH